MDTAQQRVQELSAEREKSLAETHELKMALVDKEIADERCRAQANAIEELQRQIEERSAAALKNELELARYRNDNHAQSQETRDRALFLTQELRVKEAALIETRTAMQEKSNRSNILTSVVKQNEQLRLQIAMFRMVCDQEERKDKAKIESLSADL